MQEPFPAEDSFVCVYRAADYQHLMMIKMLLEREKVNHYVENESGSLLAAPGIPMRVMVDVDRAEEIQNAIRDELGLK